MHFDKHVTPRSLYVHWPFCPYRCHFCPFVALAGQDELMGQYHEALKQEIILFNADNQQPVLLETIFMGGGTPSTWPPVLLLDISGTLKKIYCIDSTTEWTLEVNPGTVDDHKLRVWKEAGINRLSIGVQSLNDTALTTLNRHQTIKSVYTLLDQAAPIFDNLSIDLILGLPGISAQAWRDTITTVVNWPIKHLSVYFLTVHETTPLYFAVQQDKIKLPFDDEQLVELYQWTVERLAEHGFEQYELSNFARAGYRSRHNQAYWQHKPYKGFGLGACSFDGRSRSQNTKNIMRYMTTLEHAQEPNDFYEQLTDEQLTLESLMLALRQKQGITLAALAPKLKAPAYLLSTVQELQQRKLLEYDGTSIRLTPAGFAVEHEVLLTLLKEKNISVI